MTKEIEDDDNEQRGRVAQPVDPARVGVVLERGNGPLEGGCNGICNLDGQDADDELELGRSCMEIRQSATGVSGGSTIAIQAVCETVTDDEPPREGHETGRLESSVSGRGFGAGVLLLRASL